MKTTPKIVLLVLVAAIIATMAWLIATKPAQQPALKKILPTPVSIALVQSQDISATDQVTGRLQPSLRAVLQFEVAGQVAERSVEPGQTVTSGQLLLRLPDGDYQDALSDARAQLEQVRAAASRDRKLLALAAREQELQQQAVTRMDKLKRESLASQAQSDEAQTRLLQLRAEAARLGFSVDTEGSNVRQREAAINRAQRNLERTRLTAPFAGIVNSVHVQTGDTVAPSVPAVELLNIEQLDLYAEVTGTTAAALTLGQQVRVSVGERHLRAEIVALQTDPDLSTFTYAVRMRMAGNGLLPGTLAVAELPLLPLRNALVLPIAALVQEDGKAYVLRVVDGLIQRNEVVLGPRVGDMQVIRNGVEVGARVVARNVASLAAGQSVVEEKPAAGQASSAATVNE